MIMTRRRLLEQSFATAAGLIVAGQHLPAAAQASPVASPIAGGPRLLTNAGDLVQADPAPQYLAIMDKQTFDAAHIPGAPHLSWNDIVLADTSGEAVAEWTKHIRQTIAMKGLSADRPIIVYDEGTLFAALGWWLLAYLGYEPPRVLDGGLPAWNEAGGKTESGRPEVAPLQVPAIDADVRHELLATKDEVGASLDDPEVLIVDARSADEYNAGHIPGAVNILYTSNATMKDGNLYLPSEQLRQKYKTVGMTAEKRAITYCSTGVRGSVASFAMRLAGFEDVALYAGSWNEWSSVPNAPVEAGTPPST